MRWSMLVIGAALGISGCGVRQPSVDEAAVVASLKSRMPAQTVQQRISIPFSLAVYFKDSSVSGGSKRIDWKWSAKDRDQIGGTLERLKKLGVLNVYTLFDSSEARTAADLQRLVSATGAKLLLVIEGEGDVDAGRNKASRLYPFLITTFFVPGNETESVFAVGASLWDATQKASYLALTADGQKHSTSPLWFTDKDETVAEAREKAVRQLKSDLYRGFLDLAYGPESKPVPSGNGEPVKGSFVPKTIP